MLLIWCIKVLSILVSSLSDIDSSPLSLLCTCCTNRSYICFISTENRSFMDSSRSDIFSELSEGALPPCAASLREDVVSSAELESSSI